MPQNKSVNTFENGLVRTDNPTKQPKNSYSFALNMVINDVLIDPTSRCNEKTQDLYYKPNGETNTTIVGNIWLGREEYVLFIKNLEGETVYNKIIYINPAKNITRLLYDSPLLNFQDNYEIKGTYRINYKNQRIVYWVDGLNDDRLLNIDIDSTLLDISLLSVGESAKKPVITATVNDAGGSVSTGQYFIGMSYNLGEDYTTSIYSLTEPISIGVGKYYNNVTITPTINQDFKNTFGGVIPTPTSKSIEININPLDDKYTSYNLYIIKYNNDATTTTKVINNISLNNIVYNYTGNEGVVDDSINLNSIIVEAIKYYASEAITQKENRLIRGNTKIAANDVNYQQYANNIRVEYRINEELVYNDSLYNNPVESPNNAQTLKLPKDNIFKEHSISPQYLANTANNDTDNKSFMRDEIYSLGIGFELIDGSETAVFHIPGRIPNTLFNTGGIGEYNRFYTPIWDTQPDIDGNPYWRNRNTALTGGTLSYWRSDTTYSDGYGYPTDGEKNSSNKSYIRHHKMPSDVLEPIFRTVTTGDVNAANTSVVYNVYKRNLALSFSNIEIPDELTDKVANIKLYYTPRNETNKSIVTKGLLNGVVGTTQLGITYQSEGYVDKSSTVFELHSPEVNFKFKETNLQGNKIKINSIYRGFMQYVGDIKDKFNTIGNVHFIRYYNNDLADKTDRQQAIVTPTINYLIPTIPREEIYSKPLNRSMYIDNNFVGSTEGYNIDNQGAQKTAFIELSEPLIIKPTVVSTPLASYYPSLKLPSGNNNATVIYNGIKDKYGKTEGSEPIQYKVFWDTSYYISIINDNRNLYGKIENLEYTSFYTTSSISNTINTTGGDTFIDNHHVRKTWTNPTTDPETFAYNLLAPNATSSDRQDIKRVYELGINNYITFMCETDINIRMRDDANIDNSNMFFPKFPYKTGVDGMIDWAKNIIDVQNYNLQAAYKKQYLKLNFANSTTVDQFDNSISDIRYSTRIIYSDKQSLEDKTDNYRSTRANNYRDLPLNRGGITIFFTKQDKLYAITRDSLFDVFASNQTIRSENADNIIVGTGEFLSIEPTEIISIDGGYGGTSSKYSLVESPYGYLFVDKNKNKCFLFNQQLKDINILGLNENFKLDLFKQQSDIESNEMDNPISVGIIATYDPELKRLIVTKKDYRLLDSSGTITYLNGYVYRNSIKLDYNDINTFENLSFTASYDPINEKWISYHKYIPKLYLSHNTDFLTYINNYLYKSNGVNYTECEIETVFNENPLNTKAFDSLNVNLESYMNNTKSNDFFSSVLVYNEMQSSGDLILDKTNTTKKEKDWNINKFLDRTTTGSTKTLFSTSWVDKKNNYYIDKVINPSSININKPWFQLARFRDKYLIVRFSYKRLEMKKIIVNFVNTIYRLSTR